MNAIVVMIIDRDMVATMYFTYVNGVVVAHVIVRFTVPSKTWCVSK
jgi:hypothetical protein